MCRCQGPRMGTRRTHTAFPYGTWAKNDAREWQHRGVVCIIHCNVCCHALYHALYYVLPCTVSCSVQVNSSPYVSHHNTHVYPANATVLASLPGVTEQTEVQDAANGMWHAWPNVVHAR